MSNSKKSIWPWVHLAAGAWISYRGIRVALLGDPSVMTWVSIVFGLYLVWAGISDLRKPAPAAIPDQPGPETPPADSGTPGKQPDEENGPPRSLVLLLDEPRVMTGKEWIGHLGEALGIDLRTAEGDAIYFVTPMPHPALRGEGDACYMLKIPQGMFWILHMARPYFDGVEKWAEGVRDRRLREAVLGHHAWISVDSLHADEDHSSREAIYAVLGKAIAALAGPDARVILSPELSRANEFDPMLLPALSGGDPLSIFDGPTFAPVIDLGTNEEQMEAAIEEARRRWPEFVAAFRRDGTDEERPFLVKAGFANGERTEHMWITVSAIDEDRIHGTLANQPHDLVEYHEGQQVSVEISRLSDWLCLAPDGTPLGGWTQKVLSAG